MRDFRFHVASLMAVFLALGVGIFIGYAVALSIGMDPLHAQIDTIRKQDAAVKQDNKDLTQTNDSLQKALQQTQGEVQRLADLSAAGRLTNQPISLIAVGPAPSPALVDAIWNTLLLAGARRLNETLVRGSLAPASASARQEILSRLQSTLPPGSSAADEAADALSSGDADATERAITDAVGLAIADGSDPTLLVTLSHRGAPVDYSGDYTHRPGIVVILSQIDSRERLQAVESGDTPETALVQTMQPEVQHLVECERSTEPYSASSYFHRLGISSVDNVDTLEGRVALVWACMGYSGHFGTQDGADSLFPEPTHP